MDSTMRFLTSLRRAARHARNFFTAKAEKRLLADWKRKGGLRDQKKGSVYVYFDSNRRALYVGETGGGIKERAGFPTARHRNQPWWRNWRYLYFYACSDQTERVTLELLLILAYRPKANRKPAARTIARMYAGR